MKQSVAGKGALRGSVEVTVERADGKTRVAVIPVSVHGLLGGKGEGGGP